MLRRLLVLCAGSIGSITLVSSAWAQPALDDPAAPEVISPDPTASGETPVEYGVGIRMRGVFLPRGQIELFVERAGDHGSSTFGFGFELTRRRGNVELQLGIEWEGFNPGRGVWIDRGDDVSQPGTSVDVVLPRSQHDNPLGWITFEFTFLNHAPITKNLSVRYGGGAGIGIVRGELLRYDMACAAGGSNENPQDACEPNVPPFSGRGSFEGSGTPVAYNLPPVFPVVNAIIGLQFKPIEKLTINLEGGIRTFLFFGLSSSYFF
jgi:Zn-finger nucleic acid-binding protein